VYEVVNDDRLKLQYEKFKAQKSFGSLSKVNMFGVSREARMILTLGGGGIISSLAVSSPRPNLLLYTSGISQVDASQKNMSHEKKTMLIMEEITWT